MTLLPDWPAPPGVRALCSTRDGGVSAPPWRSLNLGDHVGDDPAAVATNRARYAAWLGGARPVFLRQVHGRQVARLQPQSPDGLQADASVSSHPGLACTILAADCLPILLCDADGRAVGAAHAGWRGLAGSEGHGVIEAVVDALASTLHAQGERREGAAARLLAWLGPCIGPRAFEVGEDVLAAVTDADPKAALLLQPRGAGKWLADLPGLARRRLRALGVTRIYGNDGSPPWCTVANASRFFSFRREGVTGRLAASIWRV